MTAMMIKLMPLGKRYDNKEDAKEAKIQKDIEDKEWKEKQLQMKLEEEEEEARQKALEGQ